MRRLQHSARHATLIAMGAALVLGGCVENRASVTITKIATPNSDCTVSSTDDMFISMGVLDVGTVAFGFSNPPQYILYPVVQNNLIPTTEQGTLTELNWVEIIEARIDLDLGDLGGDFEDLRFRFPTFKTLAPGESAPLAVQAIPPQVASLLAGAVQGTDNQPIVRVKLKFLYEHGEYERETHEIEFPVVLCDGCLITVPGYCDSGLFASVQATGNPCNFSQDAPLTCCLDNGGGVVCPAVDTSSSAE